MKERPILFQGAMVRALLADTKTQTRRIMKPQPSPGFLARGVVGIVPQWPAQDGVRWFMRDGMSELVPCPYGKPGDRLWVKETFLAWFNTKDGSFSHVAAFRADGYELESGEQWRPSIFMPRAGSRINLEITAIRVERVRDISEADARAEGIERVGRRGAVFWKNYLPEKHVSGGPVKAFTDPRESYRTLWDSINAKPKPVLGVDGKISHYVSYPWAGHPLGGTRSHRGKPWYFYPNPWVWVIEFRRVKP